MRDALGGDLLHEIEIYSQHSLQQIASTDRPELRLQLIDRPNLSKILRIRQQIEENVTELKALGSRLRIIRGDLDKRKLEIRDIDQFRAELGETIEKRPELPPTLEEHHHLYIQRQNVIETLDELREVQGKATSDLVSVLANREKLAALRSGLENSSSIDLSAVHALMDRLADVIGAIALSSDALVGVPIIEQRQQLVSKFEKDNETYYHLRQQEQALSESLKREDAVRRRVSELEKIEREIRQIQTERDDDVRRRGMVRAELIHARDAIFEMRVQEAAKINQEFGDVILLTVKRAAHSTPFVTKLSELMSGSRIRTQENIAEELATALNPSDLLQVIEDGDGQRLATLLSRDLGQVTRVITYLRDHSDLYELEGELFEDSLEITMFDHGQPKAVEELSEGQRATALLPLILRSSSCPLIVDQPEDDLDNSFIFEVLVKTILKLKTERQLVFVTHNANIPVLGEAEEIVVMHMDRPTKAASPRVGSLEDRKSDILHILEGGREAFEHRERSYRSLLK